MRDKVYCKNCSRPKIIPKSGLFKGKNCCLIIKNSLIKEKYNVSIASTYSIPIECKDYKRKWWLFWVR